MVSGAIIDIIIIIQALFLPLNVEYVMLLSV